MNPLEAFHNTAYSVQLSYIAGLSLRGIYQNFKWPRPFISRRRPI